MPNSNKSVSYPTPSAHVMSTPNGTEERRRFGRLTLRSSQYNRRRSFLTGRWHANQTTAFVPEVWARESVRVLTEQMVYGATVHRDFDDEVARFGETVHTRKPAELEGKRKQNDLEDVEDQDVTAADIEVKLNQRVYCSFIIGDGEQSKSFVDLLEEYLVPAMRGNSRLLDQCLGCQVYQFLGNRAGGLGLLTKNTSHDYLLDMREVFNDNKVGFANRFLGLASRSETQMQKTELFKSAEKIGDDGTALRNAMLGRVAGWNTFLELNTPSVRGGSKETATTTAAAALAGATSVSSTAAVTVGSYITIAGDMTPLRVIDSAGTGPYTLTLNRPLLNAVGSGAVLQPYTTGLVNQGSAIAAGQTHAGVADGYPANWMKPIVYDGSATPKVGQLVSFVLEAGGAANVKTQEYGILQVNTTAKTILLDIPLVDAIDDNAIICFGPDGDFNFAYQREALTLVNRPLALPPAGTGVRAAVDSFENMALRVTMGYDQVKQGTRVVVDGLFGVKKLDDPRGGVLLG